MFPKEVYTTFPIKTQSGWILRYPIVSPMIQGFIT
jgi:hypothetical protein